MLDTLCTWLTGKHAAVVLNRLAAIIGAVALGLMAIVFARMGEVAQQLFLHLVAISPYAPFVITPGHASHRNHHSAPAPARIFTRFAPK